MNLATATPREIDEKISELETAWFLARHKMTNALTDLHYAIGDRKRNGRWGLTDEQVMERVTERLNTPDATFRFLSAGGADEVRKDMARIEKARADMDRLDGEIAPLEAEYRRRPWSRFFQLRSTAGARIHDSRNCSGLYRSDHGDLGWHPELSGKTEKEAVDALGPVMCSKCFRSAPVEWRRDPKDLANDPDTCPGSNEPAVAGTLRFVRTWNGGEEWGTCTGCGEERKVRSSDHKVAKHKKSKTLTDPKAITNPNGTPLKTKSYGVIKTVRTAEIEYVDGAGYLMAVREGWYNYPARVEQVTAETDVILAALAAKFGTTTAEQAERLAARVLKKAKGYK